MEYEPFDKDKTHLSKVLDTSPEISVLATLKHKLLGFDNRFCVYDRQRSFKLFGAIIFEVRLVI